MMMYKRVKGFAVIGLLVALFLLEGSLRAVGKRRGFSLSFFFDFLIGDFFFTIFGFVFFCFLARSGERGRRRKKRKRKNRIIMFFIWLRRKFLSGGGYLDHSPGLIDYFEIISFILLMIHIHHLF